MGGKKKNPQVEKIPNPCIRKRGRGNEVLEGPEKNTEEKKTHLRKRVLNAAEKTGVESGKSPRSFPETTTKKKARGKQKAG